MPEAATRNLSTQSKRLTASSSLAKSSYAYVPTLRCINRISIDSHNSNAFKSLLTLPRNVSPCKICILYTSTSASSVYNCTMRAHIEPWLSGETALSSRAATDKSSSMRKLPAKEHTLGWTPSSKIAIRIFLSDIPNHPPLQQYTAPYCTPLYFSACNLYICAYTPSSFISASWFPISARAPLSRTKITSDKCILDSRCEIRTAPPSAYIV